tara:strand:- start:1054 stop:1287 length:234 start_codon:yes stop_codon:yes gene_type:complete
MKDKNILVDIENKSLNELRNLADNLVDNLENVKDLDGSIDNYQKLLKLNNFIQKKFNIVSKELSQNTKKKIDKILKK